MRKDLFAQAEGEIILFHNEEIISFLPGDYFIMVKPGRREERWRSEIMKGCLSYAI